MLNISLLRFSRIAAIVVCMVAVCGAQSSPRGQSSTGLPDGSVLLLGGYDAQGAPTKDAVVVRASSAQPTKLASGLNFARSGHSATVLPDGTVFIFGGMASDGRLATSAELFDPATLSFSVLPNVLAVPRAFHTATLLTDGSVLLAGGVMSGGQFPDDVQLWSFKTRKSLSHHAMLAVPREGHKATLLSDGAVRVSGGTDRFGRPVQIDEIFDPVTRRFRFASQSEMNSADIRPGVADSIPQDGAADAPMEDPISIRFSTLLKMTAATGGNFVLLGPGETPIQAKVTAAEQGRLVFVLPSAPLQPGTTYTLRIKNVIDVSGAQLDDSSITFQTAGAPPDPAGLDWVPNSSWTYGGGTTKFQELPSLQAPVGATALSGQVLKLNGWPLEHVTLEIDNRKVQTDSTGRFLLRDIKAGQHVLWIDGSTANHADAVYGVYPVRVTIAPGKTNALGYTVWMTRLDVAHAVNIPSPTKTETVVTTPNLPGVELHLPANTVIRDRYGKVVRQVTITPIPLDKPPFPLPPGVQLPVFFVVQPGGAQIEVLNHGNGPDGAQLIYPNRLNVKVGATVDFWNYDPDTKGWYIYGQGTVSPDGKSLVPAPGATIYEFTAAGTGPMVGGPGDAPGQQACVAGATNCTAADPVSLATGQFIYSKTDLALADTIPIAFTRTYISNDSRSRAFGIGTTHSYNIFLVGDGDDTPANPFTYQELILPDGGRVRFDRISPGTSYTGAVYVHVSSKTRWYGARLSHNDNANTPGWTLTTKDGTVYLFPLSGGSTNPACQAVTQITDRFGNTIKLDRTATSNSPTGCELTKITSTNGRWISLTYDTQGRITQAADNINRTVQYGYDAAGRLITVTDANNGITRFTYDDQNRMLTIQDARGIPYLTNQYDAAGRVTQQTQVDTGTYLFSWTPTANTSQTRFYSTDPNPGGAGSAIVRSGCWNGTSYNRYSSSCNNGYMPLVAQVDVTDPRGYVRRVAFGSAGYMTSDTRALGQPEQQTVTYSYYADNTLQSVTDALGRVTSFDYDGNGNVTRITRLDGTPDAVTTTLSYNGPFSQLTSVTDPLNHTSTFSYDPLGDLAIVSDPLNHQTTFAHNLNGQPTSITDSLNNTVYFGYFGGDLVSVTDPLGNVSTQNSDSAGRVLSSVDPQGNTVRYQYNPLNLVTQVTDPQGHNTTFSYDPNGNLLSLTDAANHITSWTYDNMDRVQTRTDPLLRGESYSYDLNGNLASATDRKNQVTSVTYDPLDRLKLVGYNTVVNGGNTTYESTVGYTYDAGNRMTQAVDSAGGTITEAYDNLDRLTTETTPQGSITYGYDLAGRRTSMTVAGQPAVSYTYDNANRLTQIAQGTSTVGFGHDTINRRSTLTLSNGVNMSYTYDNNSRVTGITYKFNTTTLGNLTYSYDSLGRRTLVAGSFSQTRLPGAVTSASYDAANELTNWNGTAISYDLNGNMLSDGTNTFSWNARNQVATLNSVSLQYDGFGRRTKNLQNASFLFDGANAVQELSGSTPTANLIGGGIDEIFARADSSGSFTPLKDALGSTIGLVDASGNVATTYGYDPFGGTTVSGATNSNPFQYTGRENESNGLYYYRARYYSPQLHRFISEDPLGFAGSGANFYAYAGNNPANFTDPTGLSFDSLPCILQGHVCGDEPKSSRGETFVDTHLLCNDYTSDSFSVFVITLNHQHDRYGNDYFTPAGGYGKGAPIGASHTWGCLNGDNHDEEHVRAFLVSWGAQACAGAVVGLCETYSPPNSWATERGFMTPQAGGNAGYTVEANWPRDNPPPVPPWVAPRIETPVSPGVYLPRTDPF